MMATIVREVAVAATEEVGDRAVLRPVTGEAIKPPTLKRLKPIPKRHLSQQRLLPQNRSRLLRQPSRRLYSLMT
jgi:hypothetical protein